MAETDSPAQHHPAFWLRPALVLPLALGGLCLVGFAILVDVLLVLALDPFLADVPEGWRQLYRQLARTGWQICILVIAIVAGRFFIKRIEGQTAGILSDLSLLDAMFKEHSLIVWWLLAFMVTNLGASAAETVLGLSDRHLSPFFLVFLCSWLTLRLVGMAVERAQPELWPEIQARAARKFAWPSGKMLALLLSVFAFAVFVGNLPAILTIWSLLHCSRAA